jgi:hypothetical protein
MTDWLEEAFGVADFDVAEIEIGLDPALEVVGMRIVMSRMRGNVLMPPSQAAELGWQLVRAAMLLRERD